MKEELLSIGSVIMLKDSEKRVMIIGYYPTIKDKEEITYDYSGCLFPESVIDSSELLVFNRDDIEYIYYYGLQDQEQRNFINELNKLVKEEEKSVSIFNEEIYLDVDNN